MFQMPFSFEKGPQSTLDRRTGPWQCYRLMTDDSLLQLYTCVLPAQKGKKYHKRRRRRIRSLTFWPSKVLSSIGSWNSATHPLGQCWTRNDEHRSLWFFSFFKNRRKEMWLECGMSGFPDISAYTGR